MTSLGTFDVSIRLKPHFREGEGDEGGGIEEDRWRESTHPWVKHNCL